MSAVCSKISYSSPWFSNPWLLETALKQSNHNYEALTHPVLVNHMTDVQPLSNRVKTCKLFSWEPTVESYNMGQRMGAIALYNQFEFLAKNHMYLVHWGNWIGRTMTVLITFLGVAERTTCLGRQRNWKLR